MSVPKQQPIPLTVRNGKIVPVSQKKPSVFVKQVPSAPPAPTVVAPPRAK